MGEARFAQILAHPWLQACLGLAALALAAALAGWVAKRLVGEIIHRLLAVAISDEDAAGVGRIVDRLANAAPALVIQLGVGVIPNLPAAVVVLAVNLAQAFTVLTVGLAVVQALGLANEIYQRRPDARSRPIKGYVQVAKIGVYAACAVLIVATLMDRSPVLLLSGLGAMAAVLMLVFKDTILSLVASVQIGSNDMVRVGDWIEMPQLNADGDVVDIALHTVKVQNWDMTITTIPTHRLIADSFKNWRGMKEAGARRIKRALMIDQNSIAFLSREQIGRLSRFAVLEDYLGGKQAELRRWNAARPDRFADEVNARRLTNVGTFRAYVLAYLRDRHDISDQMTLLVRQLAPTDAGLPLEIYAFTTTTDWAEYERIQADILDHLLAILPEFELRLFQRPSGLDLQFLASDPGAGLRSEREATPEGLLQSR